LIDWTAQKVRQVAIAIVGGALVLVGIALLVLPGPGIAVIALGIGVLAFEFEAPRRWQREAIAKWRARRGERRERKVARSESDAPADASPVDD